MRIAIFSLLLFISSGCAAIPEKPILGLKDMEIQENQLAKCEPIKSRALDETNDSVTMGTLMLAIVESWSNYNECAIRHDSLVEAIRTNMEAASPKKNPYAERLFSKKTK